MKSRSVLLVCFIAAAIFSSSMIGYLFGVSAAKKDNIANNLAQLKSTSPVKTDFTAVNGTSKEEAASEIPIPSIKETFILREEKGGIALYKKDANGNEKLHSSYDVPIMFLPKEDREKLARGIEFESLDQIVKFIEDYIG